jgi:hypothetical protein
LFTLYSVLVVRLWRCLATVCRCCQSITAIRKKSCQQRAPLRSLETGTAVGAVARWRWSAAAPAMPPLVGRLRTAAAVERRRRRRAVVRSADGAPCLPPVWKERPGSKGTPCSLDHQRNFCREMGFISLSNATVFASRGNYFVVSAYLNGFRLLPVPVLVSALRPFL